MNTYSPDLRHKFDISPARVFHDLRKTLVREPPSQRLADLIESVDAMERAQAVPEEFNLRFEEFVYRAEEYVATVRPFFPYLVLFLSSRSESVKSDDGFDPHGFSTSAQPGTTARVA